MPFGANMDLPRAASSHWKVCHSMTMVPQFNSELAYGAVRRINQRQVPGDIVELGVFRGGQSCMMAFAQLAFGGPHRKLWLFDTFEGMPQPTEEDDRRARRLWKAVTSGNLTRGVPGTARDKKWAYSPLDEVQATMERTGYPRRRVMYRKGKVEDTLLGEPLPEQIALLRLDTDWFESTKVELDVLWPRLVPGGWIYVDDYASFRGSQRAVDRWLAANNWVRQAKDARALPYPRAAANAKFRDPLGSFWAWKASGAAQQQSWPFEMWSANATLASVFS